MIRKTAYRIVAVCISLLILFMALSLLLGRVSELRDRDPFQVEIVADSPPPEPETPPPEEKAVPKAASRPVKKEAIMNEKPIGKRSLPNIRIYYKEAETDDYMKTLASRGCIFLIKSGLGKLFATYDPVTGKVFRSVPEDLGVYSPKSRVLAIYGENRIVDPIIEKATENNGGLFRHDCMLISLLSKEWEGVLFGAIESVMNGKDVQSAEMWFSEGGFRLGRIRLESGEVIKVDYAF